MRRSITKIPYGLPTAPSSIASFSTSSGGGGRGRGVPSPFQFTAPDEDSKNPNLDGASPRPQLQGRGRGRGAPIAQSSALPSFSPAAFGRGLGGKSDLPPAKPNVEMPLHILKNEIAQLGSAESQSVPAPEKSLPTGFFAALSGAGRGRPGQSPPPQSVKPREEARPIPARQPDNRGTAREQLSQEEKVKRAAGGDRGRSGAAPRGVRAEGREMDRGRGGDRDRDRERERGGGRGRGGYVARGRGRGGYGGRGGRDDRSEELEEKATGQFYGDPADEEKVAKKLGPEIMSKIVEGFQEIASNVLPDPKEEALLNAYETNLRIECEPEFLMEEFGTNPDIDEKPPIPLRDALEKMKPFLMTYEGIETQEEWEEIIEDTMKRVPLMKEIIDHYGGPDRVTAKQQQEELERVAKTLPASAPASVKRFTDQAVLSLQSNAGWKFDKKCQFMDKLIKEVSELYK